MITYVLGDIFTSPATVLVNTVNTVGVMGKGIAKQFKFYFPEMFETYQELCESGKLRIGSLFYYRGVHKSVLNFPTKRHWRQKSRIEDIETGLATFVAKYEQHSITSIAFPQLGCGNGELDWESQVRPLMERYLGPLPISIYVHLYDAGNNFVEHRDDEEMKAWLRAEPESLPFSEVWDDISSVIAGLQRTTIGDGWTVAAIESSADFPLRFSRGDERVDLSADDLRDVWQQLKMFGFVSASDLADPIQPVADSLLTLLSKLDYIAWTRFSVRRSPSESGEGPSSLVLSPGISLMPRTAAPEATRQLELAGVP